MVSHMKTTIDISDELLIRAKKYAAENCCSLKQVIEQGLRRELQQEPHLTQGGRRAVRWVTVPGKPAQDLDPANREAVHDWLAGDHDRG
jgi:hypothetical protein